ncbi:hypothetical protein A2U01_0095083, partial [Trifolium medium]|nr:hypothetical protein [Trifolium medium]
DRSAPARPASRLKLQPETFWLERESFGSLLAQRAPARPASTLFHGSSRLTNYGN